MENRLQVQIDERPLSFDFMASPQLLVFIATLERNIATDDDDDSKDGNLKQVNVLAIVHSSHRKKTKVISVPNFS